MKLNCELTLYGAAGHNQQIVTGYYLLAQKNLITLNTNIDKEKCLIDSKLYHIKAVIDNKLVIYYDLGDGCEIDKKILQSVDVYFKRSYLESYVDTFEKSDSVKIVCLPPNYWVYPNSIDVTNIKTSLHAKPLKSKIGLLAKAFNLPSVFTNSPKLNSLEYIPSTKDKENRKILFMARTWDPYDDKDRPKEKIEERKEINEMRAKSIRALRKEFGNDFSGGFSPTKYTLKNYKDCVFPNTTLTTKSRYLEYLKSFSICIATTGLHNSIGWKFGEYIAMSKAIVSEKLIYSVPSNFLLNENYLDFINEKDLIEKTSMLYQDSDKRFKMMLNNAKFYNQELRPDSLVLNSLLLSLERYEG